MSIRRPNRFVRWAQTLGYEVGHGSKHLIARHSLTGEVVIIPRSLRMSAHNERNLRAELRRKAYRPLPELTLDA